MSEAKSVRPLGGEPPVAGSFLLEVDSVEIGVFTACEGLGLNIEVEEYREGGQNAFVHKFPGRMSWPNLVFRRGITVSDNLFAWINKVAGEGFAKDHNKLARSTGAVTVLSYDNTRLRSWDLHGVFPVRWTGPRLQTNSAEALFEELEIAHTGFVSKTQSAAG